MRGQSPKQEKKKKKKGKCERTQAGHVFNPFLFNIFSFKEYSLGKMKNKRTLSGQSNITDNTSWICSL